MRSSVGTFSDSSASSKRHKRPPLRIRLCLSPQAHQKQHPSPPTQPRVFEPGDRVYYRSKSAAITGTCGTVQPNDTDKKKNIKGKCSVLFDDANPVENCKEDSSSLCQQQRQPRQVSTSRLLPIYTVSPREVAILVTDETNRFRQLAVSQIQGTITTTVAGRRDDDDDDDDTTRLQQQAGRDDPMETSSSASATTTSSSLSSASAHRVLEIGCSTGETSVILWRQQQNNSNSNRVAISSWVGLDTSVDMIELVQKKIAETIILVSLSSGNDDTANLLKVHCQRVDALVDPCAAIKAACTFHAHGPTVIFLDIGGNREEVGVLRMLQFLLHGPFPDLRQIIIKSRALCQSLCTSTTSTTSQDDGHDDGLVVEHVDQWLQEQLGRLSTSILPTLPKHPQKAPIRLSPADNKTPICRYHNYHTNGCHKNKDDVDCSPCPFDHVHCHFCLQPGHKALDCAHVQQQPCTN